MAIRLRIIEAEVVDQLLDAHSARGRQRSVGQEPADVRIGRGIDVDRKRRQRIVRNATQTALVDVVVGLGVEVASNTVGAVPETADDTASDAGGNATRNAGPRSCGLRQLTGRRRLRRDRHGFLKRADSHLQPEALHSGAGDRDVAHQIDESRQRRAQRVSTRSEIVEGELAAIVGNDAALFRTG